MPAIVAQVTNVSPHPMSDKLDIVSIGGKTNVANRPEPNTPRYKVGDYAVMLEDNLILPAWLLRRLDMWNDEKGKGSLAGNKGNRTKGRKIAEVMSEVALYAAIYDQCSISIEIEDGTYPFVKLGDDVSKDLGITEYIPNA
jgi:hypothetical protein